MRNVFEKQINELLVKREKQIEIEKIKKALANEDPEAVQILLKYSDHISAEDFKILLNENELKSCDELEDVVKGAYGSVHTKATRDDIKYPGLEKRLKYKHQLLNELEDLRRNPKQIEFTKVELSENNPMMQIIKKYLK